MIRWSVLVASVLALTTPAFAEDPKVEAKQHIDTATQLHKDGKLADALVELKTAYALDPQPQLLFAMGQIHVQLGQCTQAITYYERFVATKPNADLAQIANEAIETCKTNPPPAIDEPKPEPPPEPKPTPPPPPPKQVKTVTVTPSWYGDVIGDGIVVAGLASGVVGFLFYRGAVSDRDHANSAATYDAFSSLIESSDKKGTEALAFGAASAALITIGAIKIAIHHHGHRVVVVGNGTTTALVWMGRF